MCVGFNCLKNALISLNVLYMIVGTILIYVSVSEKLALPFSIYLPVATEGEIFGTFLIALAMLGIIGAVKHHQVVLFFYMIILFVLFVAQIVLSYSSAFATAPLVKKIIVQSWKNMDMHAKLQYMTENRCCDFDENTSLMYTQPDSIDCFTPPCCDKESDLPCNCPKCLEKLIPQVWAMLTFIGKLGIVFSFTEIFGVWLTKRYRNQKDPRAHPSAFL